MGMDIESMVRKNLLKEHPHIDRAEEEMKERLYEDLEELSLKYGRLTTTHALGKVRRDFTCRTYVNPYPISNQEYRELVELTDGVRFQVGDRSAEHMADIFEQQFDDLELEARRDIEKLVTDFGRYALYAYVDLLLSDIFAEDRNEYADTIVDRLMGKIQK